MSSKSNVVTVFQRSSTSLTVFHAVKTKKAKLQSFLDCISKGLGAIKAKIGPTSDVDKRGRGVKVQNWPHIILKNNARQ